MTQNNTQNNKQDVEIAELRTDVNWLKCELTKIRSNELPHLKQQIEKLQISIILGFASVIAATLLIKLLTN